MSSRRWFPGLNSMTARRLWLVGMPIALPLFLLAPSDAGTIAGPSGALNQAAQQITICHFPLAKPDKPQVMTLSAKAAAVHIATHEGDGLVGADYDETCQSLPRAVVGDFRLTAAGSIVSITWVMTQEVAVDVYYIDRKLQSAPTFDEGVAIDFPSGEGAMHTLGDLVPAFGTYIYRLRARFADATFEIIAEASVSVP